MFGCAQEKCQLMGPGRMTVSAFVDRIPPTVGLPDSLDEIKPTLQHRDATYHRDSLPW